jgi:hypothetical protein
VGTIERGIGWVHRLIIPGYKSESIPSGRNYSRPPFGVL